MWVLVLAWAAAVVATGLLIFCEVRDDGSTTQQVTDRVATEVADGKTKVTRELSWSSTAVNESPDISALDRTGGVAKRASAVAMQAPLPETTPEPRASPPAPAQSDASRPAGAGSAAASASVNVESAGSTASTEQQPEKPEKPEADAPAAEAAAEAPTTSADDIKGGFNDLVAMLLAFLAVTGLGLIAFYARKEKPAPPPEPRTVAEEAERVLTAAMAARAHQQEAKDRKEKEERIAPARSAGLKTVVAGEGAQAIAAMIGAALPSAMAKSIVRPLDKAGADAIANGRAAIGTTPDKAEKHANAAAESAQAAAEEVTRAVLANYGPPGQAAAEAGAA